MSSVDEIIVARKTLHGGGKGAPIKLEDGSREGASLNKACVVLLSAATQAFVEDVFLECSKKAFGRNFNDKQLASYRATWSKWGNPSPSNIQSLFLRLGLDDVFDGLQWQRHPTAAMKRKLDEINQVRNCIAHGAALKIGGKPFNLSLSRISSWRASLEQFGKKFPAHALSKFP
ncbi:HEPN domain-containing protein [Paracoccus sanguinis]|uniref:HEPN domain-containing protein n=1 Tax=Paracoccus sanguinis TaxID=1545044 RepID=UPI0014511FAF|nr:HEPN domain-containing protein [Paracoccus sanguinis]QJD17542.1 hypothetical protein HGN31_12160 [Paracoccus sanguinis]